MHPEKLVELLRGHKVYVQTHNYPDPDAIASAFGLQEFLREYGIETIMCYEGKVEKLSTKKMFDVFDIVSFPIEEIPDMKEEDYIVIVDAQKNNANITDFIGDEVACIDHHQVYGTCQYHYTDIRTVGSCSSIIAEYYKITGTPMSPKVGAALAYGIKMDTADFTRGSTVFDVDMFSYVFSKADTTLLNIMYRDIMEFMDLRAYGAAIDNIHLYDTVGFAKIPFDCPDALIAIISDFILSLDIVTVSIIYAIRKDGIKFSVRSEVDEIDAGLLTRAALKKIGKGGGHREMAGGFIPLENVDELGEDIDLAIEKRFFGQIKILSSVIEL